MQQGSFNPYGTRETTLFNAGPAVPSHHRNPPTVPSQGYGNSHHVIYPTGTTAGTFSSQFQVYPSTGIISIPTSKPNQPLVSSQTASQIRPHVPTTSYNSSNVLGNGIGRKNMKYWSSNQLQDLQQLLSLFQGPHRIRRRTRISRLSDRWITDKRWVEVHLNIVTDFSLIPAQSPFLRLLQFPRPVSIPRSSQTL